VTTKKFLFQSLAVCAVLALIFKLFAKTGLAKSAADSTSYERLG
jgi:hypothetical protein